MKRFVISYDRFLFEGDADGHNVHTTNDLKWVLSLINAYGDDIVVDDRVMGMTFAKGEWN